MLAIVSECTTESQSVVFIAELSYTALPGVDMPSLLTSWVTSNPHIIVASTQLQVDPTCPVVIDSLQPKSCLVAFMLPPTDPATDLPDRQQRSLLLKSGCFSCPCCDDCYCCHSDSSGSVL